MIQLLCGLQGSFLSLKWERHHLLNKKGKVGRHDRLNSGGHSLLLLSAQPSVRSSCISAVSTWNGNCHLVGHRLKLYLPASSKRKKSISLQACIIPLAILYVRKHTESAKTLRVFPTLALPGRQSKEICLCEAISFLNTVGCGMSCQKGISAVPCRLNKPWPDPKFCSSLCVHDREIALRKVWQKQISNDKGSGYLLNQHVAQVLLRK